MYFHRWRDSLIGILIVLFGLHAPRVMANPTIVMVTTEFAPYMGAELSGQGALVAITTEAFRREGYSLQVRFLPWVRGLAYAKEGQVDGVIGLWYSQERAQWFAYSRSVISNKIGFYERRDHPVAFTTLNGLKPYVIGTVRAYANPPAFDAAHLQTEEAVDDITNLRKLAAGHLDLILVDKAVAQYLIDHSLQELKNQLKWVEPPVDILPLYVGLSKKAPDFEKKLAALNAGMESMQKDGSLAKLALGVQ